MLKVLYEPFRQRSFFYRIINLYFRSVPNWQRHFKLNSELHEATSIPAQNIVMKPVCMWFQPCANFFLSGLFSWKEIFLYLIFTIKCF